LSKNASSTFRVSSVNVILVPPAKFVSSLISTVPSNIIVPVTVPVSPSVMIVPSTSGKVIVRSVDGSVAVNSISLVFPVVPSKNNELPSLPAVSVKASPLVFEGTSVDGFETIFAITDPTTIDKTITFPDATGTVALTSDISSLLSDTLTDTNILVGNGSNVATGVALSGDATIANTGALTISDNSVDGTDIALGSDAQGDVMYYDGTDWVSLAAGTNGQFLQTQGGGADPQWASGATGDITAVGDVTSGDAFTETAGSDGNSLFFEGTTGNTNEIQLTATEPSTDRTITLPDVDGTIITDGDTGTVTGTMILDGTVDISDDTNLAGGTNITLSDDTLNVDDAFLLNTGDTGTGTYAFDDTATLGCDAAD